MGCLLLNMEETRSCKTLVPTYLVTHYRSPEYSGKKVKAIPLQALTGPEGFRGLRLPDFKTIGT
jgi:hypothetical protein